MKKIVLLLVIAGFGVSACKKDKTKSRKDNLSEYIERTWFTIDEKSSYYDEANTITYEETAKYEDTGELLKKYRLNDGEIKFTENSKIRYGSYILSKSNGKNMITMILNGNTEAYEIVSIDDSLKTWRQEVKNVVYTENGQEKTAARKVKTVNLHCPCH